MHLALGKLTLYSVKVFVLLFQVYIAEVSPAALRGLFSAVTQLTLAFGILLVYCIGSIPDFNYDYVALVAVGITALFTLLMVFFPETPRFLLIKNKRQDASKVLRWLRGSKVNIDEESFEMEAVLSQQKRMSCLELVRELSHRSAFIPLILMVFVMAFQQFCGINGLVFYGIEVLESAGISRGTPFVALLTIGLTELVFTLVTVFTVDLIGRKILLVVSGSFMTASCFSLGATFYLNQAYPHDMTKPLAVVSVLLFMMGFALGWGAIPWTLVSEIFPLQIRGLLGGVVSAVNWACAAIVTGFYHRYARAINPYGVWWTFGAINLVGVGFVAILLPETRGKPLEFIELLMQNRYTLCSWK